MRPFYVQTKPEYPQPASAFVVYGAFAAVISLIDLIARTL